MKIKSIVFLGIVTAALAIPTFAQKNPGVKFTSVYTNLGTSCKFHDGENGTDGYSICKGPTGYRIRIYSAAAATFINAESTGKEGNFSIKMVSLDFNESKTKVEWRLANGKPFALIMRVPKYGDPADSEYIGKVIGQELVVVGLLGHEKISATFDVKTTGVNAKAREEADKGYFLKD
jgi:hypothetical protein